jgi:hypothetical protein
LAAAAKPHDGLRCAQRTLRDAPVPLKKRQVAQNLGTGRLDVPFRRALIERKVSWRKDCYTYEAAIDAADFSGSVGRGS